MSIFLKRIRDLREDHDETQEYIADYLKIDRKTYNRIERGIAPLKFEIAVQIARHYNISLDYIAGFTDVSKKVY